MKKSNRKGFTIVELVIVIAVIAILAAVLIPTFSNLVKKANISNDTAIAKNMNTILTAEGAEGKITDVYAVIEALTENGLVLANINAKANGCLFVWEQETNQILLIDTEKNYKVLFAAKEGYGEIDDSWYFVVNDTTLAAKVREAQPNANVLSFFETPDATVIETPLKAVASLIGSGEDAVASTEMYVEIPTNGATITEVKIGNEVYGASDTFLVSIGSNKFVTFNYFTVVDGKTYLAAPVAGFDAEAKYGVVNGTLVMDSGVEDSTIIEETYVGAKVSGVKTQLEKNDKGQYVLNLKVGDKNPIVSVDIPGATAGDSYISKKSTGGYGMSKVDNNASYAGNAYGYSCYPLAYGHVVTAEDNGFVRTTTVYVVGKGYLTFEVVLNIVG